jgi:Coenzyme PQQ synthesis protein D (PqqD)
MLVISNTIRRTRTPDGGILLDVERGQMFSLDPVGSKILDLLDEGCDEAQIVDQVSAVYGQQIEMVRIDVRSFLEALSQHHVVRQGDSTAAGGPEATHGTRNAT